MLSSPRLIGALLNFCKILLLAYVNSYCIYLGVKFLLKPPNSYGGVEAAGVGEDYLTRPDLLAIVFHIAFKFL